MRPRTLPVWLLGPNTCREHSRPLPSDCRASLTRPMRPNHPTSRNGITETRHFGAYVHATGQPPLIGYEIDYQSLRIGLSARNNGQERGFQVIPTRIGVGLVR